MDKNAFTGDFETVEGRNPVAELLKARGKIKKIFAVKGLSPSGLRIIDRAKGDGIVVEYMDRRQMDSLSRTGSHQGIIALIEKFQYVQGPEAILENARDRGQVPLVVVLDRVYDPHNLGAVIRTAHCCGVHGIIIPKKNAAAVTPAAVKAAAGATEYMAVARVTNTVRALEQMKGMGLWVAGADADGTNMYETDLKGPIALVMGSEGKGLGRLIRERCDFLVSIPMKSGFSSLNVSVAAAVLLYEVIRQREC